MNFFIGQEIELRKMLNYPPFCDIIMVRFNGENIKEIQKVSKIVYDRINNLNEENILIYKPVPSPIDKIKNKYRWRIIAKCNLNNNIINLVNITLEEYYKIKIKNVRVIADVNPNNMN